MYVLLEPLLMIITQHDMFRYILCFKGWIEMCVGYNVVYLKCLLLKRDMIVGVEQG